MKVRFHKKLYSQEAVKAAVEAFSDVANITTSEKGSYVIADIETSPTDMEVVREFANYVLGETIAKRGES